MKKEEKQKAIDILRRRVGAQREQLRVIEPRLLEYYDEMCAHVGTELGDENDLHNGFEVLCAVRLLRLLRTYDVNQAKVDEVIYDGEGEWQVGSDGYWTHVRGGLGQPGRNGTEVYRWEPFQVFMIVAMYGLKAWIGTGVHEGERRLIDTERVNAETGEIEDHRRLCTRFILFGPRKINKSGFAAITNVEDFMRGDYDAQVVCTANSQEQSKILFGKTKDLLLQLDPVSGRKFNGKFLTYTNTSVKFQKGKFRAAELIAIPAGGKLPDGKFASRSAEDEYGSAGYTNGRSDMGQTAAVIESSMGPRREPMTVITTTASLITSGPFMEMLESTHSLLLMELEYDTGDAVPNPAEDRQSMLLLEPDEWERDEDYLLSSRVLRRKVNPMLGKIVQHSFYDSETAEARMDETKKKETISKLFNVYQTGIVTKWIRGDRIRPLQVRKTIDDCVYTEGWRVFVGLDFSHGDDLFAVTYLAVNYHHRATSPAHLMFADTDCWVLEKTMKESPNRQLYEQWVSDGWLHVCPGEVFDSVLAINAMAAHLFAPGTDGKPDENRMRLDIRAFCYDPAQSVTPINNLKAWLQSIFTRRGVSTAEINTSLKQMVIPVSQSAMTFNPIIGHLEEIILAPEPWIDFSMNPMWPWQFDNVAVELGRSDLRRFVKGGPAKSHKHDSISALGDAVYAFDLAEGRVV